MQLSFTCLKSDAKIGIASLLERFNKEQDRFQVDRHAVLDQIETLLARTDALGPQALWEGYADLQGYPGDVSTGAKRRPAQVRTVRAVCRFYVWLAAQVPGAQIVEIGTAFGASGMHWLAGLEHQGSGWLFAYEPNTAWGDLARQNMGRIGTRFTLTSGPVEAHEATLPDVVDIALIDAIHQTDVVLQQMALLRPRCRAGSLIILDDINFSPDMQQGWQTIAARSDFREAWQIGARTGIVVV